MRRKLPRVNPLELRKELLVAESELNRAQLLAEWQAMGEGIHQLTGRVKSVGSLASAAAVLMAGWSAFRRDKSRSDGEKSSWIQTALNGAQMAASLWLTLRPQGGNKKE